VETKIVIKKSGQGRYVLFRNDTKVLTASFTKKNRPFPALPVGYEVTIRMEGSKEISFRDVVKSIAEGKRQLYAWGCRKTIDWK